MENKVQDKVSIQDVISHYNIIGLGVGVAIGIAGKDLAFSLSNDIVIPIVAGVFGAKDILNSKKLDVRKFISAILTFIIVFSIIIFILYIVLRPMVREDINGVKEYRQTITDDLGAIVTYQKNIDQNTRKTSGIITHQQKIEDNTDRLANNMFI